ncbi:protein kinase family protein [Kibdelosporangium aridum]|uniref:protein kinase family protein n=1 Tax=Kibdelosporangium aridum TaxID=2030 RepID=UPI00068E3FC3
MGGRSRVVDGLLPPDTVIGDGRYRLLEPVGADERDGAQLWRARDGKLDRDVALTVLTGDSSGPDTVRHTLQRAASVSRLVHPGVAPVLNVLSVGDGVARGEGIVGIIAAEWTRGTGMTDVVAREPVTPVHACLLLEPLADAMDRAHRRGVVLGVGHPLRIRVTPAGTLRLAFPGPPAGATLTDDVRGLGTILYFLLTGSWPVPGGPLVSPRELQPEVPVDLSEIAIRSIADVSAGGIRTSDSILRVLRLVSENAERATMLAALPDDNENTPDVEKDGAVWITKPPVNDAARRKKVAIAAAVLVLISIGVIVWVGATVIGMFL